MPLAELQPGDPERIGPYRVVNRLGSGGMGRVYLGRSPGGRLVAVKVIRPDLAHDADFRARFAREAAAARQVSGLFTAAVVDWSAGGAMPWLATAFVRGPSLADAVAAGGPLEPGALADLAAGLAEGLAAIHAAGVTHRDLKPTNVILADDGPRVIDFGISRTMEDTGLTRTGEIIGSPGFMSPEQAEGRAMGPASDIFSLGAVLAFAAAGRAPFGTGDPTAILYRIVHTEPDLGQVPGPLRPLIERCLAKDPATRPTARQFLDEVTSSQHDGTQEAAQEAAQPTWPDAAAPPPRPGPGEEPGEPEHERTVTAIPRPLAPADAPTTPPLPGALLPGAVLPGAVPAAAARRRRRILIGGAVAAVAVLAVVAGLLVALTGSPPSRPTGLAGAGATGTSVSLQWTRPASGTAPDHYLISEDGRIIGSVPASRTHYQATGLAPDSAYTYRVIAQAGDRRSGPSAALTVHTGTPPLSAATLTGAWQGSYIITSATDFKTGFGKGDTRDGAWRFVPGCAVGPCPATLYAIIGDFPFTVRLTDANATYTGTTFVRYTDCSAGGNRYMSRDRLSVQIAANQAALVNRGWAATSWNGNMTLSAPAIANCDPSTFTATFSSASPTVRLPSAGPVVTSVSPLVASPGQSVTIRGTNFGATQRLSHVDFTDNGTNWGAPTDTGAFTVDRWSNDAITFTMPTPSGTNGESHVVPGSTATVAVMTTDGGISNGATLTVSFPSANPAINSVSPPVASASQVVTITGVNFGASQSIGYVHFTDDGTSWGAPWNTDSFRVDRWSNDAITFTVPTPSGTNGEWHVTPGTTATITVGTADSEVSTADALVIGPG